VQSEIFEGARKSRIKGLKKNLPAIAPSAVFSRGQGRAASNIKAHTGLVCLDFDCLGDGAAEALERLKTCPYTAFANLSISGGGLFAIVQVPALASAELGQIARLHKQAYSQLATYFANLYGLEADKAASDVSRLRLMAPAQGYEYHNPAAKPFELADGGQGASNSVKHTRPPKGLNDSEGASFELAERVTAELANRGIDITADYQSWVNLGLGLAYELGESGRPLYHNVSCNHPNYTPEETDAKFSDCLKSARGGIGLGTLFYLAETEGGIKVKDLRRQAGQEAQKYASAPAERAKLLQVRQYVSEAADSIQNELRAARKVSIQAPTGSGKTEALIKHIAPQLGQRTLLAVPLVTQAKQIETQYGIPAATGASPGEALAEAEGARIAVCTYDMVYKLARSFTLFVIDEGHELCNSLNFRAKAINSLQDSIYRYGQRIVYLSATPNQYFEQLEGARKIQVWPARGETKKVKGRKIEGKTAEAIIDKVKAQGGRAALAERARLLVFHLNSIDTLNKVKAELVNSEGFQDSDVRIITSDSENELAALAEGAQFSRADGRPLVVLCTAVIQSGLNIKEPQLNISFTYIQGQVEPPEPDRVCQLLGRFRTYASLEAEYWHRIPPADGGQGANMYQLQAAEFTPMAEGYGKVTEGLNTPGARIPAPEIDSVCYTYDKAAASWGINEWGILHKARLRAARAASWEAIRGEFARFGVIAEQGEPIGEAETDLSNLNVAYANLKAKARGQFYTALAERPADALELGFWRAKAEGNRETADKIKRLQLMPETQSDAAATLAAELAEPLAGFPNEWRKILSQYLSLRGKGLASWEAIKLMETDKEGQSGPASKERITKRIADLQRLQLLELHRLYPEALGGLEALGAAELAEFRAEAIQAGEWEAGQIAQIAQRCFSERVTERRAIQVLRSVCKVSERKADSTRYYKAEAPRNLECLALEYGIGFTDSLYSYIERLGQEAITGGTEGDMRKALENNNLYKRKLPQGGTNRCTYAKIE
jgi:hypothetical protein